MVAQTIEKPTLTLAQSLQRNFVTGLFLLLPLLVSIYILLWLYQTVTGPTLRVLREFYPGLASLGWRIGLGIAAFFFNIGLVLGVGILTRHVVGRRLFNLMELLIGQVPLLNKIYGGTKQIIQGFSPENKAAFQRVALVEFPRKGSYTIGFVAGPVKESLLPPMEGPAVNVFIPTTPNPTSGFLLMVSVSQVYPLEMTVADGIKMVISGGTMAPGSPHSA